MAARGTNYLSWMPSSATVGRNLQQGSPVATADCQQLLVGFAQAQEFIHSQPGVADDGAESAAWQVAWMMWHGRVTVSLRVVPDFVAAFGLPVKDKASRLEAASHVAISHGWQATQACALSRAIPTGTLVVILC